MNEKYSHNTYEKELSEETSSDDRFLMASKIYQSSLMVVGTLMIVSGVIEHDYHFMAGGAGLFGIGYCLRESQKKDERHNNEMEALEELNNSIQGLESKLS